MNQCVSDIPVGARMVFHFAGSDEPRISGEVLHNYGASIVVRSAGGRVIQFNAQDAETITAEDAESERLWTENIARRQREFEEMMARMSRQAEAA